ncbi:MAG: sulfatase, partial [Gemmatimonadales bacterium]|nr:sulfatase [Gemmatimonadales bacterium]
FGGPAIFAAGGVLPLQAPLRMNRLLSRLTGRPRMADPLVSAAGALTAARIPAGIDPGAVRFTRRPDIVIALIESLRSDFLDTATMPRLARRAEGGAVFERHYTAATSTHYSLFSLFFGLQSQKLDAVVGAGRSPLLFGALRANGYDVRLIAASSVDWMGLRQTVFGAVQNDLETELTGMGEARDAAMLTSAQRFVERTADDRPLFLFLFFDGTHFNYTFPDRSARFRPHWNGGGSIEAALVAPLMLERRARNAAYEVDWKLDEFLDWFEARRGRPLLIVTSDHGEEFREHGRVGHGSDVTEQQVHVPMVLLDSAVAPARRDEPTSHVDVLPTLLSLLGDRHPPASYSDGVPMLAAPPNRFVLTSVGWEPRFAVIGPDLKVTFAGLEGGFHAARFTDPCDRPLADAEARFRADAVNILRAFRSEPPVPPAGAAPAPAPFTCP